MITLTTMTWFNFESSFQIIISCSGNVNSPRKKKSLRWTKTFFCWFKYKLYDPRLKIGFLIFFFQISEHCLMVGKGQFHLKGWDVILYQIHRSRLDENYFLHRIFWISIPKFQTPLHFLKISIFRTSFAIKRFSASCKLARVLHLHTNCIVQQIFWQCARNW